MDHITALKSTIDSVGTRYHRLAFLVGMGSDERSDTLAALAGEYDWPTVNLGTAFSQQLLDIPHRHRATSAPQILADLLDGIGGDILLLDHVEVLFSPDLAQDPVMSLQGLSRNRTLVVSWPGTNDGVVLSYGEPSHPEYYRQSVADLVAVDISSTKPATQSE
jgi:hypothetical protein